MSVCRASSTTAWRPPKSNRRYVNASDGPYVELLKTVRPPWTAWRDRLYDASTSSFGRAGGMADAGAVQGAEGVEDVPGSRALAHAARRMTSVAAAALI